MTFNSNLDSWDHTILKDLATINYGKSPKGIISSYGDYPVVGTGGTERYGDKFIYDGESIILGRKGTIDRVHFVSGRFWTIDTAYYLSDFVEAIPRWLFYYLQSVDLRQLNEATGVPSLSRDLLYKIDVLKPPTPEQSKIAEVLSKVDQAIEQTESLIAKQQRIKTGLMQDLLTRGIDEHGNLRSEETHEFKDSPLGRIPVEWEVSTLGHALAQAGGFLQTGPFGSQLHSYEYVHEGIPAIMPQDIWYGKVTLRQIARITDAKANELHRHRLKENDIVFSRRGDLTRAADISSREIGWVCGTGCFLLRVPVSKLHAPWLSEVYRFHYVQRQVDANAVGSTMPSLNNSVMEQLIFAFPSVDEQRSIVELRNSNESALQATRNQVAKLRSLKTALMQDLLTGKIRVTPLMENMEVPS